MPKLIVQSTEGRREFELGAVTTIGRHPDNQIQILDRIVSKEHAQVIRQPDGRFLFRDLGSLNGSFFKAERISDRLLIDGDEIIMGSTHLVYQERAGAESAQRVTIEPAANETFIRQRLQAAQSQFLPEKQ